MDKKVSQSSSKKEQPNPHRPNLWGMIRDIVVHSMNKGQLPLTGLILLFAFMIYKLDGADVKELIYATIKLFGTLTYLGWVLSGSIIVTWSFVNRRMVKNHRRELDRINVENEELQKQILDKK